MVQTTKDIHLKIIFTIIELFLKYYYFNLSLLSNKLLQFFIEIISPIVFVINSIYTMVIRRQ